MAEIIVLLVVVTVVGHKKYRSRINNSQECF